MSWSVIFDPVRERNPFTAEIGGEFHLVDRDTIVRLIASAESALASHDLALEYVKARIEAAAKPQGDGAK